MEKTKESPFLKYLRKDRLPNIFCEGCGIGTSLNVFLRGMEQSGKDFDNISMVSGIGCSSRIPGYVKCDSLHTTHGRSISFATGLKLSNPDMDVVVFTGDGDAAAIGGNHLIHAARRNIDLTVICINNNIYGMTGGQISPTSPLGSFGSTAPFGSVERPFNLAELVVEAGATYSARWTTYHALPAAKSVKKGLENEGFSFIEIISQCPTYFGRKNKLKTAIDMINYFKENSVNQRRASKMSEEELKGKIIIGEFVSKEDVELSKQVESLMKTKKSIKSAYGDE